MKPNTDNNISHLFWIEEYKSIVSDIQTRVSLQHGLLNAQFLFVLGVSAYLFKSLLDNPQLIFDSAYRIILLIVPIVLAFISMRHLNHDVNIIDKAKYIHRVIRLHAINITGEKDILGFEEFIDEARRTRAQKYGFLIWLGGEHMFHFIFLFVYFIGSLYSFFFAPGSFVFASNPTEIFMYASQDILLIINIFMIFQVVRLLYKVGIGYGSIVSDYKNKGVIKKSVNNFFLRHFRRAKETQ